MSRIRVRESAPVVDLPETPAPQPVQPPKPTPAKRKSNPDENEEES